MCMFVNCFVTIRKCRSSQSSWKHYLKVFFKEFDSLVVRQREGKKSPKLRDCNETKALDIESKFQQYWNAPFLGGGLELGICPLFAMHINQEYVNWTSVCRNNGQKYELSETDWSSESWRIFYDTSCDVKMAENWIWYVTYLSHYNHATQKTSFFVLNKRVVIKCALKKLHLNGLLTTVTMWLF